MGSYSSPLLDQFNRDGIVTPGLQRAIEIAKQKLPTFQFGQPQQTDQGAAQTPALRAPGGTTPVPKLQMPNAQPSDGMAPGMTGVRMSDLSQEQPLPAMPQPGIKIPSLAAPLPTPQQQHQSELARLTTGDTGKSGIDQIHNAWLRTPLKVLDAIGTGFFPRLVMGIPGTSLHHQMDVRHAQGLVDFDQKQANEQATNEHLGAETNELGARAGHEQAEADALKNPQPKEEMEGKTITTDQGIMQWNPQTKRYDVKAGDSPEKPTKEQGTVHQLADGTLIMAHPDGTATPVTVNGQPVKGKEAEPKAGDDFAQFYKKWLAENKAEDTASSEKKARAEWSASGQAPERPERPPQAMMFVPDGKGGYTAQSVHPGQTVGAGAVNASGLNSQNELTSTTRSMVETAPKVLDLSNRIGQLIDQQAKTLGPAASRWNEYMAGKIGAPNPEFTKLRTDVGLLQTALMRMHVGARGGEQMMQHFHDLIDVSKQSPENLKAALEEIVSYAKEVQAAGHPQGATSGQPAKPANPKDPMGVF